MLPAAHNRSRGDPFSALLVSVSVRRNPHTRLSFQGLHTHAPTLTEMAHATIDTNPPPSNRAHKVPHLRVYLPPCTQRLRSPDFVASVLNVP